jgi:hypothetical protein
MGTHASVEIRSESGEKHSLERTSDGVFLDLNCQRVLEELLSHPQGGVDLLRHLSDLVGAECEEIDEEREMNEEYSLLVDHSRKVVEFGNTCPLRTAFLVSAPMKDVLKDLRELRKLLKGWTVYEA